MKLLFIFILIIPFIFISCENKELSDENQKLNEQVSELKSMMSRMRESDDKLLFLSAKINGIKARIKTNFGNIEVKFYPEIAPLQCFNFITRAESGFYDGTQFHRIIPGFMIQGGDPLTKGSDVSLYGSGGPIVSIPHEFSETDHKRGVLSTARTSDVNAGAGSQFFIMHADYPSLNKQYTAFGEVTKGMDIVDKIATTKTTANNRPIKPVKIVSIEVYK